MIKLCIDLGKGKTMPDPIDEIITNLSPTISERTTENRIQTEDGTSIVVSRTIERIVNENGEMRVETITESTTDAGGRRIESGEDVGGICVCGRPAHRDFFYICQRCGRPQCSRCVAMVDGVPYCSWCSIFASLRRLFRRGGHDGR